MHLCTRDGTSAAKCPFARCALVGLIVPFCRAKTLRLSGFGAGGCGEVGMSQLTTHTDSTASVITGTSP